ncbi:MAG: MBL fold metallo-hydrolase [Chitinophagaceae bacterium]|nr:MBL fold metallo-hydrolase [Chitinophagaceae bacterium]
MSLFISSINSGSNGNCYYIGNTTDAILVDAGISCRETERRMKRLGLSMALVRAIFISHEHIDHISGVPGLSKKYQLPVYITTSTFGNSNIPIADHLIRGFDTSQPVEIAGLQVQAFTKSHDAVDPHSFVVSCDHLKVGVFTDIGYSCKEVTKHFKQCHAVFLESNYCEDMLEQGGYPYFLKQRISGDRGHLSNRQALELFLRHRGKQLSHLILSHLSKNNNSPDLVDELFRREAGKTQIVVASRYAETAVFSVGDVLKKNVSHTQQLSLFDV